VSVIGQRDEFAKWLAEWMAHLEEAGHLATSIPADGALTFSKENAERPPQPKLSHTPCGVEGKPEAKHRTRA
jgi:hypothetical protein